MRRTFSALATLLMLIGITPDVSVVSLCNGQDMASVDPTTARAEELPRPANRFSLPIDKFSLPIDKFSLPADQHLNQADQHLNPADQHLNQADQHLNPAGQKSVSADWWNQAIHGSVLPNESFVSFDLPTIMIDTLVNSPRIRAMVHRVTFSNEQIVQQDAAFDASLLLDSRVGRTSDPVGNTLTTGGPPRLFEESWKTSAGIAKTQRDGTRIDIAQQTDLVDSNSLFFLPGQQGSTRLSLSMTRPMLAGSGGLYNQRLWLQAKIDSKLTWEEFQREVQTQLSSSIVGFWRLYEARCHLVQRRHSLAQGEEIARMIVGRSGFDSGPLEMAKAISRIARRRDAVLEAERIVMNNQILLIQSVGSPALTADEPLELIPNGLPVCTPVNIPIREAVMTGMSNRPEIRSAALDLESGALAVAISRRDLLPKLDAVVSGYLAGLNGDYDIGRSFTDQFRNEPGASFGVVMERPVGNRAAKSKLRASQQRYLELAERYRDAVSNTASEIALAIKNLEILAQQAHTKGEILSAATVQESLIRKRWETLGTDGRFAALVLEDLLEQQELLTAAEADFVSNQTNYLLALVELHRAMGTLLIAEGLEMDRPTDHTRGVMFPGHPKYNGFVEPQTFCDGVAKDITPYPSRPTR